MRYTERGRERQRHRQREKQAPRREPNVGLDPGSPGWCPGPKAGAKSLSHPGIPCCMCFVYRPHHSLRLSLSSCIFSMEWKVRESMNHFWVVHLCFSYLLNEWMNKRKREVAVRKADLGKLKNRLQSHLLRRKDLV